MSDEETPVVAPYIIIEEYDNQGDLDRITSIIFDDIHTITAIQKQTGNLKREFTLHRKSSDVPYILDNEHRVVAAPHSYDEWIADIAKRLKVD